MSTQYYKIWFICIVLTTGCSSWKEALVKDGGRDEAIHNAIIDFVHTSKLCKRDKVFNVYVKNIDNEIVKVIIIGTANKLYSQSNNKIRADHVGSSPTRFTALKGKLFYWYDKGYVGTDDAKKGVLYYFYKNDISKYKKITTNKFMDEGTFTKLKCKFPQNE